MAVITNYASLQAMVADTLARNDLTDFVPNFIQNAESKIYRRLNIRAEENTMTVSVANGFGPLPTRFKKLKVAYVNSSPIQILEWMPLEDLYREYPERSGGNIPCRISRNRENFEFGPFPADFTLSGTYYQKLQPLRTSDGNWYVVNAPDVLFYGALIEAQPFIQGDKQLVQKLPIWQQFYKDSIASIEEEEREQGNPSGRLVARVA